jgi:glycerophosphoryl diester phosphodiesterase
MELHTLGRVLELEPKLRRGWTYPKTTRDYTRRPWMKPVLQAALAGMRLQLPGLAAEKLPQFGVFAMWVYHPLVSAKLASICERAGVELIAWTVDDERRMRKLVEMGVDGLVSNDPRLYQRLDL